MFAKIRTWWSTKTLWIRRLWFNEGPADDCFWWMDVLFLLAGIRSALTSNWTHERKIIIVCHGLFIYNFVVFYLQLWEGVTAKINTAYIIMELTKVTGVSISCMRMVTAALLIKPMTALRRFITSNSVNSGDAEFDERERMRFARIALQVLFGWMIMDTALLAIPSSTKDDLFRFPIPSTWVGGRASSALNILLVALVPVTVLPKCVGCTACIGVLLMGMRTKLRLLAHRFEIISQEPASNAEQYFGRVNREVRSALDQCLQYWRYWKLLKRLVGKVFLLMHYFSVFAIGAMFYSCHEMGISYITVAFVAGVTFSLSEYFLLCYLIDSLKDEATCIEQHIFNLCPQIPFSQEHRSEYVQLRTALMIIWINTRNGMSVDCLGLFVINTPKFVALSNVAYSVLTFLIQMAIDKGTIGIAQQNLQNEWQIHEV